MTTSSPPSSSNTTLSITVLVSTPSARRHTVASRTPLLLPVESSHRQPETLGKERRVLLQGQVRDPRKRAESPFCRGSGSRSALNQRCKTGRMRIDPEPEGSEFTLLLQYLDYQRETVLVKTEGLTQ